VDEQATTLELSQLREEVAGLRERVADLEQYRESPILDYDGAAAFLGCGRRTLERLVAEKRIPFSHLPGERCVRFYRPDLEKWVRNGCPRQGTPRLHSRRDCPNRRPGDGTASGARP